MKLLAKRSLAWMLSLLMCISLLSGLVLTTSADSTVNYVYSGKYIYNWGDRDTVATFLSPNAIQFYKDNNVTYEQLAAYAGSNSTSGVPSSNLYQQLQTLMKSNHSHETSYAETRDLFRYTDCQNSGSPVSISSFYSGKSIGPAWDGGSTWNREHTWPNSKGDASGNGENDIMMLRPTASSENSSRGNKAYGESSTYYDPNGLGQKLRGDVARIMLFVYVRWGNTGKMWGSAGVMESKAVLLKWMQEDPVDTWELGRNDATEAITGTRNVFVDYPELAFELFEEQIPAGYQTPSGVAAGGNTPNNPDQPNIPTPDVPSTGDGVVTDLQVGVPYKLGLDNGSSVYYATGEMSGYYGATDTSVDAGADVYLESANNGYHMYINNGSKQYINLVQSGTYYNYTYGATATSVYTWDAAKKALCTTVGDEVCYIGTYGSYVTMGVLRTSKLQDTDYIARLYGSNGGGTTPDVPPVTPPTEDPAPNSTLTIAEAVALGSTKSKDVYTEGKYYVTGTVKDVDNVVFGNMTLTDGKGNDLYVYGTYNSDGTVGYSSLNPKPVVGDTVTLYGTIGMYNEPQMKNGWFVAHIPGSNPDQPSVSASATLDFGDKANRTSFSTSQQVWAQNDITLTNSKGSSTSNVADYAGPARFYKGSTITIAYPGMQKLVIMAADGSAYSKDYASPWADSFNDSNATASVNTADCIVTITFAQPVDTFTWDVLSNQARAYSIEVFDGSEDVSHTHEYDNNCDAICNTCDAVRIVNHVYDDAFDASCNACGAIREVAEPGEIECNHIWVSGVCDLCGEPSPTKVTIVTQPAIATYGKENASVDVTVKAEGDGLKYQWYYRNSNATDYSLSSIATDTYTAMLSDLTHNRRLYCVITDCYGNQVKTNTVLIRRQATITKESSTASYAKLGAKVKASVTAIGDGLKYTWYVKNSGASKYSKSSITSSTYSVKMSDKVNNRRIYCVVTDKYGKTDKSETFVLRESVSITTQPKTTKAAMGKTAKITVKARGNGLKYTWYVKNSGSSKYSKSSITSATYSVKMSGKVKNRRVYCIVTDQYGNKVQTNTCIIRESVSITTQPKSVKVAVGKTAKVTVKASGDGLKYTWYFKNSTGSKYTKSSVSSSTYSVKMSKKSIGRRLYCVVTDKYGNKVQSKTVLLKTP